QLCRPQEGFARGEVGRRLGPQELLGGGPSRICLRLDATPPPPWVVSLLSGDVARPRGVRREPIRDVRREEARLAEGDRGAAPEDGQGNQDVAEREPGLVRRGPDPRDQLRPGHLRSASQAHKIEGPKRGWDGY